MRNCESWTAGEEGEGVRLDKFLGGILPEFSRTRLQSLVRRGFVLVNGNPARPSLQLKAADSVSVSVPDEPEPATAAAEEIPLAILYEDPEVLVLDKPAGLVVHPGAGNATGTLVNALLFHCAGLSSIGGVERPGIVHRLDKETSGCLVIAKSDASHASLSRQFAERQVKKTYLALVEGVPRMPHGKVEAPIGRHTVHRQKMAVSERGREAVTTYRVLAQSGGQALVQCQPLTGRTHQIRVHLKHLGHPVAGDPLYGRRGAATRHFLHAWKLRFTLPLTGKETEFCSPLPADFPGWAVAAAKS